MRQARRSLVLATLFAAALATALGPPARADDASGFDYLVLSLSWSPAWCAAEGRDRRSEQCADPGRWGFVVHGLWPQRQGGRPPRVCALPGRVPDAVIAATLPVMPSAALIQHEWATHGTCGGSPPAEYFARLRRAFASVRLPAALSASPQALSLAPGEVKAGFLQANPGLSAGMVVVVCKGRTVREVRVCLDKDLAGRSCGAEVGGGCPPEARLTTDGR